MQKSALKHIFKTKMWKKRKKNNKKKRKINEKNK